jgi:hypothetical protein
MREFNRIFSDPFALFALVLAMNVVGIVCLMAIVRWRASRPKREAKP